MSRGEYARSIGAFRSALATRNGDPEAHHDLAIACYRLGEVEQAVAELQHSLAVRDSLQSWLALATIAPFSPALGPPDILRIRTAFVDRLSQARKLDHIAFPQTRSQASRRLNIGYVSAFFDQANYMKPVWGLLNQHDRKSHKIHLFSDAPLNGNFAGYKRDPQDALFFTNALSNAALARLISRCRIDILVDLNGYSEAARLPLLFSHAARRMISWFNMFATAGSAALDGVVGDDVVAPPGEDRFFAEKVYRLSQSYLSFAVPHRVPPVGSPPCAQNGYLTFGTLAPQYKLTRPVLDAWVGILESAPTSRLLLANQALRCEANRQYLRDGFAARGVDPERLLLHGPRRHYGFLEYYGGIDIALDTFPYNGGTTTMEAIWQGVPVLTFCGDRWVARTSSSLLAGTPFQEFVASDLADYAERAVEYARDRHLTHKLKALRHQTRQRLILSSVCDTRGMARKMERLYRKIVGQ